MKRHRIPGIFLLVLSAGCVATGESSPTAGSGDDAAAAATAPPSSTEAFARLEMLAGRWDSEALARRRTGEILSTSAAAEAAWDLAGRYLEVRTTYKAEGDSPPSSRALFTWDEQASLYRTWTFHSSGEMAAGTMRYDPETRTWAMTENWYDPRTGSRGTGRGFMRFESADEKVFGWERGNEGDPDDSYVVEGTSRRIGAVTP